MMHPNLPVTIAYMAHPMYGPLILLLFFMLIIITIIAIVFGIRRIY